MNDNPAWTFLPDAESVAEALVERISTAAREAIGTYDRFRLVLAGGRTPQAAYARLAESDQDWVRWEVLFGDERCLPLDHPQRNSRMAEQAWLDRVPIPAARICPIPAELGPEAGAQAYHPVIAERLPFDLVLLGVGEDGHTASLFPGREDALESQELVLGVRGAPKPPPQRVSLSPAALGRTDRLVAVVTGSGKRDAVRRWRAGERLPIARVVGEAVARGAEAEVLIDRAAMPSE